MPPAVSPKAPVHLKPTTHMPHGQMMNPKLQTQDPTLHWLSVLMEGTHPTHRTQGK